MIAINAPFILRIIFKVCFSAQRITKPAGHMVITRTHSTGSVSGPSSRCHKPLRMTSKDVADIRGDISWSDNNYCAKTQDRKFIISFLKGRLWWPEAMRETTLVLFYKCIRQATA